MMNNLNWENYRHSDFLKSLNYTESDLKLVRLFLNKHIIANDNNIPTPTYFQLNKITS
jgi:hypothetical protein